MVTKTKGNLLLFSRAIKYVGEVPVITSYLRIGSI